MPLPRSLGFVTVTTPGQPVPLSASQLLALSARLQPRTSPGSANIGNVYIGNGGMNKNTGANVYAILSPEQVEGFQFKELVDLGQVWMDADNSGDGCLASYTQ